VPHDLPLGHFKISICGGCGLTEWYARNIDKLRADGHRVLHIEGEQRARANAPTGGGPYR
jgi:hypothetical protein